MSKKSDEALLSAVEKVLTDVMNNPKAKPKEKMDAAGHAMRLMQVKHKINDESDKAGSFFK